MQNEERINCLETQVRTLKRIVYGFGCLLVAGVVVSATSLQTVPDVIQAKKFEVVNDEGKKVAVLFANEDGGVLGILNKDEKVVALLGANEDGGSLSIFNKDGGAIAGLGADEDGGELVTTNNKGELTSTLP